MAEGHSSEQSASASGPDPVIYSHGGEGVRVGSGSTEAVGVTASVGGTVPSIGPSSSPPVPVDAGNGNGNTKGNEKGDDNARGNDDGNKGHGKDGRLGALKQRPSTSTVATAAGAHNPRAAAASPIPPALMQIIAANAAGSKPNGQVVYVLPQRTLMAPAAGAEVGIPVARLVTPPVPLLGPVPPLDVPG